MLPNFFSDRPKYKDFLNLLIEIPRNPAEIQRKSNRTSQILASGQRLGLLGLRGVEVLLLRLLCHERSHNQEARAKGTDYNQAHHHR